MTLTTRIMLLTAFTLTGSAIAAPETQLPRGLNAQSDQAQGLVTITSDLALNDGRLIITVVAYNKGAAPAPLRPEQITVITAAGKPVPLASLAQLEDETRAAFGGPAAGSPDDYSKTSEMQRPAIITSTGERDVSGYTGGDGVSTTVSAQRKGKPADEANDPKLKAALEGLRAGVLQGVSIAPRSASGGQVVTQAIKFARKEERKLKVSVEFAGERHEFQFAVPRQ